jgi:hypothetical protein
VTDHRSTERGLYDKLQREEFREAREFLELQLSNATRTYQEICVACKASMLFEDLKDLTPQDLTRYRQKKSREENRATVMSLIESESETLLNAAVKNPSGVVAKFLRKTLAETAVARFDAESDGVDVVNISREAARHALVEQRDRKLDLDEEKLKLENKRLEIQERQAELARDKFGIAAMTWKFILGWFVKNQSSVADAMAAHSDELLSDLEAHVETNG